MLKYIVFACFALSIICSSCKNALGPDNARHISGTYIITVNSLQSPSYGDYLIVTKVNKSTVKVTIDYANSSSTDIVIDKMTITKNGSDYNVDQSSFNFSSSGIVNNNTFTLNLNYLNGSYIQVVAVK